MEIGITRGKKFLKDKTITFILSIETLSLSTGEHSLVPKYGDPKVNAKLVCFTELDNGEYEYVKRLWSKDYANILPIYVQ